MQRQYANMTLSQQHLRAAEAAEAEESKLRDKINQLEDAARQLAYESEYHRKSYAEAYKEELTSRRNYVEPTMPRLTTPNPGPSAEWGRWRALQDRVTSHKHYCWQSGTVAPRSYRLAINLARFNSAMMGITNSAAWNPRNPAPYLP